MLTKAPRGTKDLFGNETLNWRRVEQIIIDLCKNFGFYEIRTPIFEHTELFQRGVGETTDIVQKEMYTFTDKGERSITLKPEGTAGVARAYIEHNMQGEAQPTKLFYITPAFRYERPQAGRMRQFHQFGVEMIGSREASADAEVISLAALLLERLGITKVELHINSLGGPECRKKYNTILKDYLGEHLSELCPTCQERYEKNPLRALDCKVDTCQAIVKQAPSTIDALGEECKAHFEQLKDLLTEMNIPFVVDPGIVRGLDYYTRTVFEFISKDIGSQGTVCGGGRYDGLIEECGGKPTPAVGFAIGIERLLMVMEAEQGPYQHPVQRDLFIGAIGDQAMIKAHGLIYQLRKVGISAEGDHLDRSVRAQMKYANKIGASYSFILGDEELKVQKVALKNMDTGEQEEVELSKLVETMKQKIEA
ncbi:MAG: histidine--tRNA ligase [Epulopiscium sp.]|nr:histidine--tRNA ligase [Candidatus Epulonipiscium sp.]